MEGIESGNLAIYDECTNIKITYAINVTVCQHIPFQLFLDINRDVRKVKDLLAHLDKDELKDLFLELGLFDATVLNKYSGSVSVYANDLIRSWIQGRDDVLKSEVYHGGPTWENLKKALIELNHNGIAEKI